MTTTDALDLARHALYRFFADDGSLLYVGISVDPGRRWKEHAGDKPWWQEVAATKIERFGTRQAALDAERAAIVSERPRYNVTHNGGDSPAEVHVLPAQPRTTWIDHVRWRSLAWLAAAIGGYLWITWFSELAGIAIGGMGIPFAGAVTAAFVLLVTAELVVSDAPRVSLSTMAVLIAAGLAVRSGGGDWRRDVLFLVFGASFSVVMYRMLAIALWPRPPALGPVLWSGPRRRLSEVA